jgi:hypothetical protein
MCGVLCIRRVFFFCRGKARTKDSATATSDDEEVRVKEIARWEMAD